MVLSLPMIQYAQYKPKAKKQRNEHERKAWKVGGLRASKKQ